MGQALAGAWWQQCPDCEQWRRRQNGETNKMVLTLHKNIKDVMMKSEGGEKRSVCVCWDGRPEVHHAQEAYCARGSLWRGLCLSLEMFAHCFICKLYVCFLHHLFHCCHCCQKVLEKLKKSYASIMGRLGDPLDDGTLYGPLHSKVRYLKAFCQQLPPLSSNLWLRSVSIVISKPLRTPRLQEEILSLEDTSLIGCERARPYLSHHLLGRATMWSPLL